MSEEEVKKANVEIVTAVVDSLFKNNRKFVQIPIDLFIQKNNELGNTNAYSIPNKYFSFELSSDKRTAAMDNSTTVHPDLQNEYDELVSDTREKLKEVSFITQALLAIALSTESTQEFRDLVPDAFFSVLSPDNQLFSLTTEGEKKYADRNEKAIEYIKQAEEKVHVYIGQSMLTI